MAEFDPSTARPEGEFDPSTATPYTPPKSGLIRRGIGDTALSIGQGAVGAVKALADATGANNRVSRTLGDLNEGMYGLLSPERQAEIQNRAQIIDDADKSGSTFDQVTSRLGGFVEAPLQTTAQGIGSIVPTVAAALATRGRSLGTQIGATTALGAGMGVGGVKGQNYEAVLREATARGMAPAEAEALAEKASAYSLENAPQQILAGGLGALASTTGAERLVRGVVTGDTLGRRVLKGALAEGLPEGAQGAQQQFAQNVALNNAGFETDPGAGVLGQGLLEGVVGGVIGAGFGVPRQDARPAPNQGQQPEVERVTTPAGQQPAPTEPAPADPQPGVAADAPAPPPVIGPLTSGVAALNPQAAPLPVPQVQELDGQEAARVQRAVDVARFNAENADPPVEDLTAARRGSGVDTREMTLDEANELAGPPAGFRTAAQISADGMPPPPVGQATELDAETIELESPQPRREPRTPKPERTRGMTDADVVRAYVEQRRNEGTLAGRRFAGDFDAGRITPEDVLAAIRPRGQMATPDERIAAAAQQRQPERTAADRIAEAAAQRQEPAGLVGPDGGPIRTTLRERREQRNVDRTPGVAVRAGDGRGADSGRSIPPVGRVSAGTTRQDTGTPASAAPSSPAPAPVAPGVQPDQALTPAASDTREQAIRRTWASAPRKVNEWTPMTVSVGEGDARRSNDMLVIQRKARSDGEADSVLTMRVLRMGKLLSSDPAEPLMFTFKLTGENKVEQVGRARVPTAEDIAQWEGAGFTVPGKKAEAPAAAPEPAPEPAQDTLQDTPVSRAEPAAAPAPEPEPAPALDEPWKLSREQAATAYPGDEYDRMLNRAADVGDISYTEADRRARINSLGQRKFWAKTRADLEREGKEQVAAARGDRAAVNKMKGTPEFANWRIRSMSAQGKAAIESAQRLARENLAVHKERVQEALMEGKDVPAEVLADYPDLKRPALSEATPQPAPAPATPPPAPAVEKVSTPPAPAPEPQGGFDPEAWDKARADRIKASREVGNVHLDTLEPYVETMRGKAIRSVHDPKVKGTIFTVDNNRNVYVDWADAYSQEKEGAVPMQYGRRKFMQSTLGPRDLKDYVLDEAKAPAPAPTNPPAPAAQTRPERLIELRKRQSVLKQLLECLG